MLYLSDGLDIDAGTNGVDIDTTGNVNIASSKDGASAVVLTASAGGVDITATGAAAGEDINITATGSSVNITSTEDATDSIVVSSTNGGIKFNSGNYIEFLPNRFTYSKEITLDMRYDSGFSSANQFVHLINDFPIKQYSIITKVIVIVLQKTTQSTQQFKIFSLSQSGVTTPVSISAGMGLKVNNVSSSAGYQDLLTNSRDSGSEDVTTIIDLGTLSGYSSSHNGYVYMSSSDPDNDYNSEFTTSTKLADTYLYIGNSFANNGNPTSLSDCGKIRVIIDWIGLHPAS